VKTKTILGYVAAVIAVLLLTAATVPSQEKRELITVKNTEVSNGVVIITAQGEKTPVELQCNKDYVRCTLLKPGEYAMVRLPKNRGMYDCSNVIVYDKGANTDTDDDLGRYCITEK